MSSSTRQSTTTAHTLASAIDASAAALPTEIDRRIDLESALVDASAFGRLAYHALCHLGFENREPPMLDQDEADLVYWTISELGGMIDNAKAAFYAKCEAEAHSRVAANQKAAS